MFLMLDVNSRFSSALSLDTVKRLSVAQYHAMVAAEIFTPEDQVELLQGWVITKMPKKPRHSVITGLLFDLLLTLVPAGWFVHIEGPISTADSEPEPDVAVIRGTRVDYIDQHPSGDQIGLIIEVADSSLLRDQTTKKEIYAAAGVPIYWVVNLRDDLIEIYSDPQMGRVADYRTKQSFRFDEPCAVVVDGNELGKIRLADSLK